MKWILSEYYLNNVFHAITLRDMQLVSFKFLILVESSFILTFINKHFVTSVTVEHSGAIIYRLHYSCSGNR